MKLNSNQAANRLKDPASTTTSNRERAGNPESRPRKEPQEPLCADGRTRGAWYSTRTTVPLARGLVRAGVDK